jgi:2-polyprenyl-3-methyl-5-hydroxy-6-metoxy-1,4-benzoquinol methylase
MTYMESGMIKNGKAMELGCGPGRNAIYLALNGFSVDAFDLSETAIEWAKERANDRGLDINFICQSVFEIKPQEEYDFILALRRGNSWEWNGMT